MVIEKPKITYKDMSKQHYLEKHYHNTGLSMTQIKIDIFLFSLSYE